MTETNLHNIFYKSCHTNVNRQKNTNTKWKQHCREIKEINFFQQAQKKIATTNIKIISTITGSDNHYSLISLNINRLNSPLKMHRLMNWILKKGPRILLHTENKPKYQRQTLPQCWKPTFRANGPKKQANILILNEINFQQKYYLSR